MIEIFRSSCPEVFCKEGVLKNFAKIHRKTPVPETMAQVFSCEFCEISKNTFFYRTPLLAASEFQEGNDQEKAHIF